MGKERWRGAERQERVSWRGGPCQQEMKRGSLHSGQSLSSEARGMVRGQRQQWPGWRAGIPGEPVSWPLTALTGPDSYQLCAWKEVAYLFEPMPLLGIIMIPSISSCHVH